MAQSIERRLYTMVKRYVYKILIDEITNKEENQEEK